MLKERSYISHLYLYSSLKYIKKKGFVSFTLKGPSGQIRLTLAKNLKFKLLHTKTITYFLGGQFVWKSFFLLLAHYCLVCKQSFLPFSTEHKTSSKLKDTVWLSHFIWRPFCRKRGRLGLRSRGIEAFCTKQFITGNSF